MEARSKMLWKHESLKCLIRGPAAAIVGANPYEESAAVPIVFQSEMDQQHVTQFICPLQESFQVTLVNGMCNFEHLRLEPNS